MTGQQIRRSFPRPAWVRDRRIPAIADNRANRGFRNAKADPKTLTFLLVGRLETQDGRRDGGFAGLS